MAGLVRLIAIRVVKARLVQFTRNVRSPRAINTFSKLSQASAPCPKTNISESTTGKSKNWVSWGFDDNDKLLDRLTAHTTYFVSISLCIIGGGFIIAYMPDSGLFEWAQREAYIQLRYKEDHDLPPIDVNYLDPAKIVLPTDEDLGDDEIII